MGERLGTEPKLLRRYGVSREPFREAIQILERQGIVSSTRGGGGGVIIQAPAISAVSNVIRTYFEFSDVSFGEVMEAHTVLQRFALELAVERMTPAHANDIYRVIERPRPKFRSRDQEGLAVSEIHAAINRVAGNPSLAMLIFTLTRTIADFGHQEKYPRDLWQSMIAKTWANVEHSARCVIKGDSAGAIRKLEAERKLVEDTVFGLARQNERIWNTSSYVSGGLGSATLAHPGRDKAATMLAYRLAAYIRRKGLEPGTTLGTEPQLMKRFKTSRAIFRAALRMLEFFGVVTVKRGAEGGLTVTEPNSEPTVHTAVLYLRYFQPEPAGLQALRDRIQTEITHLASTRVSYTELRDLLADLKQLQDTPPDQFRDVALQVHGALVNLAGNAALSLVTEIVLSTLVSPNLPPISRNRLRGIRKDIGSASGHLTLALGSKESAALVPALHGVFHALNPAYAE